MENILRDSPSPAFFNIRDLHVLGLVHDLRREKGHCSKRPLSSKWHIFLTFYFILLWIKKYTVSAAVSISIIRQIMKPTLKDLFLVGFSRHPIYLDYIGSNVRKIE